ncbi:MAG: cell division protein FtsZ, partial [Microcella sp.]|nr:cell division protein FtsZ [Microcella sp.]
VHPEANIIFGAVIDDTLGDEVRVTVIAAGFDGGEPTTVQRDRRTSFVQSDDQHGAATVDPVVGLDRAWSDDADLGATAPIDPIALDDDELDVPEFLR